MALAQPAALFDVGSLMGMHIWYRLTLGAEATFAEAIEKITRLHRYVQTVGFRGAYELPPVGGTP